MEARLLHIPVFHVDSKTLWEPSGCSGSFSVPSLTLCKHFSRSSPRVSSQFVRKHQWIQVRGNALCSGFGAETWSVWASAVSLLHWCCAIGGLLTAKQAAWDAASARFPAIDTCRGWGAELGPGRVWRLLTLGGALGARPAAWRPVAVGSARASTRLCL